MDKIHWISLTLTLALFCACSFDRGIDPQLIFPTIKGTVYFEGEKPENTEWVVVVASRDFPPSDVLELAQAQSEFLNLNSDSAEYEILLPTFGTYAAVGAVWKGRGEPLALSDVLGIYGVSLGGGFSLPDSVTVTPAQPVAEGIDFVADFGRVNRGAVIRGRITYRNPAPEDTEIMAVAAYRQRPRNLLDYLDVAAISVGLPLDVEAYDYRLAVSPGTYGYIVVLWKGTGTSLFDFKEVGFYQSAPGVPGSVTVAKGDTVRGVDILVEFSATRR